MVALQAVLSCWRLDTDWDCSANERRQLSTGLRARAVDESGSSSQL